jgi:hypothetical protein
MTAYLVFSESEPMIVVASRAAVSDGRLVDRLRSSGLTKFIASEIPVERLRERYGVPFEVIEADICEGKDVRVLDHSGRNIFENISLADLGSSLLYEEGRAAVRSSSTGRNAPLPDPPPCGALN